MRGQDIKRGNGFPIKTFGNDTVKIIFYEPNEVITTVPGIKS